jgi:hypothetical protein
MTDVLPEALRSALGQVIADQRREWRRERELMESQSRETIAELRARVVELERKTEETVSTRLAVVRDGVDGKDGLPGPSGDRGEPGAPGEPGPPGAIGEIGPAGPVGPPGQPGEPGLGVVGPQGETGAAGSPGPQGDRGEPGVPGARGEPGLPGEKGEPGERGTDGIAGRDGADGIVGAVGERGPEGPPGKLSIVRNWEDGVYYEGEVVTRDGATYQALKDTGRVPPHDDWICIASRGQDAKGFDIRGTFNVDANYYEKDIVALNGGSFIALKDDPGICPGVGWQLLTSPGKKGKDGNVGPRGERGERGLRGDDGAGIIGGVFDAEQMKLVLSRSDGGIIDVDMYDFAIAIRNASV